MIFRRSWRDRRIASDHDRTETIIWNTRRSWHDPRAISHPRSWHHHSDPDPIIKRFWDDGPDPGTIIAILRWSYNVAIEVILGWSRRSWDDQGHTCTLYHQIMTSATYVTWIMLDSMYYHTSKQKMYWKASRPKQNIYLCGSLSFTWLVNWCWLTTPTWPSQCTWPHEPTVQRCRPIIIWSTTYLNDRLRISRYLHIISCN